MKRDRSILGLEAIVFVDLGREGAIVFDFEIGGGDRFFEEGRLRSPFW